MKALIYNNKEKDFEGACKNELIQRLEKNNIEYMILEDEMLSSSISADVLFAIGGDGTILFLADFANRNSIPVLGINAGKLGFLCEFEKTYIENAVNEYLSGQLIKDERTMISINHNGKSYNALNEIYLQRIYDVSAGSTVAGFKIEIDDAFISKYSGDGAIISTPTGSTAYAFSLGAPILSPHSDVFTMIPIAPHSFNQRPIVYSADSICQITVLGKNKVGIFIDGKLVDFMNQDDKITITKLDKKLMFLRKKDYNFFKKLSNKLYKVSGEKYDDKKI